MKRSIFLSILGVIFLAGCAAGAEPSTATPPAEPETIDAKPTTKAAFSEVRITLTRSGGIAGIQESWTISADGQATAPGGLRKRLTPEAVTNVIQELEALGFFELDENYLPRDSCCDRIIYELNVSIDGKVYQVKALEAEESTPPAFWQAAEVIRKTVETAP